MEERTLADFQEQLAFIKAMGGTDVVVAEQTGAVHQRPVSLLPNRSAARKNVLAHGSDTRRPRRSSAALSTFGSRGYLWPTLQPW